MRLFFLVFLPVAATVTVTLAADDKPPVRELTISQIMKQAHIQPFNRGTRNNLDNKVVDGKATAGEKQQLLDLYAQLGKLKPPKGDAEGWAKRTGELVAATKAVVAGEEKAAERFLKARNCKECHAAHR